MVDLLEALRAVFSEVFPYGFYRDIFPVGSFEDRGVYESGKYNGIAVCIGQGERRTRRLTVTDDLYAIDEMADSGDFCIMAPISYCGKSRRSGNARLMYALAIDLDGIETVENWEFFMQQIEKGHEMLSFVWGLPRPTYVVYSGNGVHLYYVFEKPVPMFDNIVKELEKLKRRLTWQAWTQGASVLHDNVQYESLFQAFRVVGTITKNGDRCRAFRSGDKVTVEYLNKYVPEKYRAQNFAYQSKTRLKDAAEKWPAWYENRVVNNRPRQTWTCKKDLYDWWIRKVVEGAEQGHRYWCVMTLAVYAKKCGVPRSTLESDAYGLIPLLNSRGDAFTEDDVLHALEAYADSYYTYPIDTIVQRTGIAIERNRRNGRKQQTHLRIARAVQAIDYPNGEWRSGNGRKSKEGIVREWCRNHPDGTPTQAARDLQISRTTVYKYWSREG